MPCRPQARPASGKDVFDRSSAENLRQFLLVKLQSTNISRTKLCKAARLLFENGDTRRTCAATVLDYMISKKAGPNKFDNNLNYSSYDFTNNFTPALPTPGSRAALAVASPSQSVLPLHALAGGWLLANQSGSISNRNGSLSRALAGLGVQYNVASLTLALAQVFALKNFANTVAGDADLESLKKKVSGVADLLASHASHVKSAQLRALLEQLVTVLERADVASRVLPTVDAAYTFAVQVFRIMSQVSKQVRSDAGNIQEDFARTQLITQLISELVAEPNTSTAQKLILEAQKSLHPVLVLVATAMGSAVKSGLNKDLRKFLKAFEGELALNGVSI